MPKKPLLATLTIGLFLALTVGASATADFPRFSTLLKTLESIKDGSCRHVVPNSSTRIGPAIRLYANPDADNGYLLVQRFMYWNTEIFAVSAFTKTQSLGSRCREAIVAFHMQTGAIEAAGYLGCLTKKKWHTKDVYGRDTRNRLVGEKFLSGWEKQGEMLLSEAENIVAMCVKK
jgi:hypothetical protein